MYKYACGKWLHISELNWPYSTSPAKPFASRNEIFLFLEKTYSTPEKVFTHERGSCSVNKTPKAWAFFQKDFVAYLRLCHDLHSPAFRRTIAGRDFGRPWGWGVGCLESRDCLFSKTFCSSQLLLSSPPGTPDDNHIYIPAAFPCCGLSHHCSQPFSSHADPSMQGKPWCCHQGGSRAGSGETISEGAGGLCSWLPPMFGMEGHGVCRQMRLGQEGVTKEQVATSLVDPSPKQVGWEESQLHQPHPFLCWWSLSSPGPQGNLLRDPAWMEL